MVFNEIDRHCKNNGHDKVFTFGIGSGCDKSLVINSAKKGKGDYSIVEYDKYDTLNA